MRYRLTLTPLTPVHIGSGEVIDPFEYVILERLIHFRPEQFLRRLDQSQQERFLRLAANDILVMREFVRGREEAIRQSTDYSFSVHPRARAVYEERLKNIHSDLSVHPCIRTSGLPFIPGSSLKGALRTALLFDRAGKPVREYNGRKLEAETLGCGRYNRQGRFLGLDASLDPFRLLKTGDSQATGECSSLQVITVHTWSKGRWRDDIPMLREVVHGRLTDGDGPTFAHTLQTVPNLVTGKTAITADQVIHACRLFYDTHLEEEKKFLRSFPEAHAWYVELEKTRQGLADNAFLLRFGWGSGFDGVTVNYARSSREYKRSRRLTADAAPLGWVEITISEQGE